MATIIEQAMKGKRKALEYLYETNKQKVFYISLLLSENKDTAIEAANYAFRNTLVSMATHGISTEDAFTHLVIHKAVDFCKRKTRKKDSKAFRIPQNRNFLISGSQENIPTSETTSLSILKGLPVLQRYILVLHVVGEYLPEQIAGAFKFNMKTVGIALESEQTNVERILHKLNTDSISYSDVIEELRAGKDHTEVPASVDEHASAVIDNIAKPIEKKARKRMMTIGAAVLAAAALIVGIVLFAISGSDQSAALGDETSVADTSETDETDESGDSSVISSPVLDLDETLTYYADIEIADYGTVSVRLDQEAAPITVSNFVNLAQNGFYDGLTFHRIIEGFMMQGGDPNGDGTGGSDSNIVGEFTENGYDNSLSHTRGAISMARSSDYNSASSQFFIVHEDSADSLDGQYAVFGYVSEGMDVVDAICESAEPADDNGSIEADAQPVITSITIRTESE